jgi:heptaprenyl diphosphate synthase
MTPSAVEDPFRSGRLPVLVATAAILQISESMLPHPIPGLRFGLANIVTLIILVQEGFKPALVVTLLRTVVSAFVMGSFLSPGFILSFSGGCASITVAGLLQRISDRVPPLRISPVGLGIAGAFVHNMVQLGLAYLLLIHHPGIFFLVPWLSFGAVILGAFSGYLAAAVLKRLAAHEAAPTVAIRPAAPLQNRVHRAADTWLHRSPAELKIAAVLILTLSVVLYENLIFYGALFVLLLLLIPAASLSYARVFQVLKKLWAVILSAVLLPLYFNPGSQELFDTPLGSLHLEAVESACVFGTRLLILALFANLVAQTTETRAFTRGIRTYLRPFERFGLNSSGVAETLSLSLAALPTVWVEIRSVITALLAGKPRNLTTLKAVVIQLFLYLFSQQKGRP